MNDQNKRSTSLRSNNANEFGNRSKLLARDISESLGKLPPQAIDLEEAVLGALLCDKNAMIEVAGYLRAEHFYTEVHKEIYSAIQLLFAASDPIDLRSVYSKLRSMGKAELIGGASYLSDLYSKVSSAANIEYHSRVIVEYSMKRSLIQIASQIHHDSYEDVSDVFSLIEKATSGLQIVLDDSVSATSEKQIKDLAIELIRDIQNRQAGIRNGLDTGFPAVDRILNGLKKTDLIIIAARPGMGKGLSLDEKLLTPAGWIQMRDVRVGTMLAGSDGKFYPVTGVYPQGVRQTYKVLFDDNSTVICDDQHLWYTNTRADRKIKGMRPGTVKNIIEIKNTLRKGVRKNHSIPFVKAIQLPEIKTTIHPYVMGVLLGDGCTTDKSVSVSNPELDILKKFDSLLPEGYSLSIGSDGVNHNVVSNGNLRFWHLIPFLQGKHSYEKSIPDEFLINSIENRIALLQGLMDTDSNVSSLRSPWVQYSTTSEKMAYQVVDLVRGLGGRCYIGKYKSRYKKNGEYFKCRDHYRLQITFTNGITPVSSEKHLRKYIPKRHSQKFIVNVTDNGFMETQCITVDSPDHLFVTTGTTLTHNTAFVVQIILNLASQGIPIAFFSLEMSGTQLSERMAVSRSEIDSDKVQKGIMSEQEFARFSHSLGEIASMPIFIDDTAFISIIELRARCMKMKAKRGVKMIVIDYLQLVKGTREMGGQQNREQEISLISRTLKGIAKELDIPVIALSQLSRSVETRGGSKKPMLSDLRESGAIEQDADIVGFLYRPEYYKLTVDEDGMPTHGMCEVIIAKNRNGSTDTVKVKFVGKFTKFSDWHDEPHRVDYTSNLKNPAGPERNIEPELDLNKPF